MFCFYLISFCKELYITLILPKRDNDGRDLSDRLFFLYRETSQATLNVVVETFMFLHVL